jgi:hypothetical protein
LIVFGYIAAAFWQVKRFDDMNLQTAIPAAF